MNWTAIVIVLIVCSTINILGRTIERIFEKKYNQKSFLDKWFSNNDNKEENK